MSTTIQQQYASSFSAASNKTSLWKKFISWCEGQEKNRLGWLAGAVAGHGCVLTILTMAAIIFSGNHFIFWPFAIAAMGACLVVNLAALPTKITIPVFFISVLIDMVIIASCMVIGFNIGGTYI